MIGKTAGMKDLVQQPASKEEMPLSIDLTPLLREGYVDKEFLMKMFKLSASGFEWRLRHGKFPAAIRIGKKRYWKTTKIRKYLNSLEY
jgi:hypothetical protein